MGSYDYGKQEVCEWIREHVSNYAKVLDVGACDGKWRKLLDDYTVMDACEIFIPNAHKIQDMYRSVFVGDIYDYFYNYYDLIIFGDVIEHMSVDKAKKVLEYAKKHAGIVIVGVPFEYKQDAIYGNPWEKHVQDDLTPELFEKRYPGFDVLLEPKKDYRYYVWKKEDGYDTSGRSDAE